MERACSIIITNIMCVQWTNKGMIWQKQYSIPSTLYWANLVSRARSYALSRIRPQGTTNGKRLVVLSFAHAFLAIVPHLPITSLAARISCGFPITTVDGGNWMPSKHVRGLSQYSGIHAEANIMRAFWMRCVISCYSPNPEADSKAMSGGQLKSMQRPYHTKYIYSYILYTYIYPSDGDRSLLRRQMVWRKPLGMSAVNPAGAIICFDGIICDPNTIGAIYIV